jgi:hypothetical protein
MPRKCRIASICSLPSAVAWRLRHRNIRYLSRCHSRQDRAIRSCGLDNDDIVAARLDTPRQIVDKWCKSFLKIRMLQ